MTATALAPRPTIRTLAYGSLTTILLAAIVLEVVRHATGYWQVAAFGIGPDLALFLGAGANLDKGQLHPRAVPLYNLGHRYWLPLALLVVALFHVVSFGYLVGALAWCFHISLDRTVGYGLRTRDGHQRR